MCPYNNDLPPSAAELDLDQRLRNLRGSGQAPAHSWDAIAKRIASQAVPALPPENATPSLAGYNARPSWFWASAAVLLLSLGLSLISRTPLAPWPTTAADGSLPALTAQDWAANTLISSEQALNQQQLALAQEWPVLLQHGSALNTALISPELNAIERSRQDLQNALRQNPDSAQLIHQLARLDQWQVRLMRQLAHDDTAVFQAAPMDA